MPTIKDVAREAEVSIKTVSRVLNGDPAVKASTAERVRAVVAELAFVPDPTARAMRTGRSATIGLIDDDVVSTPYAVEIIRGVQDACAENGIQLLIANARGDAAATAQSVAALVARRVDGIVFATRYLRGLVEIPAEIGVPVVLVNCTAPAGRDATAIVPDDAGGSAAATEHLIGLGHVDIALVSINPAIQAAADRAEGFRAAMRRHGLNVPDDRIQPAQHFTPSGEVYVVEEAVDRLFERRPWPSAILCGTDVIALKVANELRARGLTVPYDVSIVGFDDFTLVSENLDPPLTTVALPYHAMGHRAATLLIEGTAAPGLARMPCRLVIRASCTDPAPAE